ncbi:hypothetical protein MNV49_004071 [Pseudohyphozyma bogoriensis]|nr:hypothetical protein MNV49_004071 [Pseudohyphozyma bogoriensis]
MAPQKGKLPQCEVCKKEAGKYRCPVDDLPYCSVVCFKSHKSAGCSSENTYKPPEPTFLPPTDDDAKEFERPIKRLKDLHWPPEPSSMFWDDPLQRDDVKPLRGFEYEALATSPAVRTILASPSLRTTLSRLATLPRSSREASLRVFLGLPPDPAPTTYRPSPAQKFSSSSNPAMVGRDTSREHELIEHIYHPKTPPEGAYKARLFILIALLGIDAVVTFWYLFRELRESHRHGRRTWWIWRMVEQPHGSGSYLVTNYRPLGALLAGTTMLTFMAYAAMEYRWSFTETSQRWASAWRDAHLLPYICHGWFLGWGIFQVILALRENGWMDVWAQHMYAEGLLDQAAASWTGGEELSPGIAADVQKLLYLATYNASHYIGAMRGMQVAAMGSTFILNLASFILYITIRRQVNFNKRMHRPKTTNFPATVQVSIARPPLMRGSSCASMRTVDSHNHFTMPVKHNEGLGITSGMEMPESNAAASSAPPKHVGGGGPRDLKAAADIVVVLGIYLLILSSSCTAIQIGAFFVNQFQYPAINTTHVEAIRFMNLWVFGIFSLPIPFMMAYLVALLQCLSSIALAIFFLNHAWYYDRFDSLNFFKAGRAWKSREAFKRLMVFLYILGCPSFAIQGGFYAYIKYKVGFLPLDKSGMPVPYTFWPEHFQAYIMQIVLAGSFISAGLLFGVIVWHTDDPLEGEAYLYLFGSGFVLLSNFVFFRVFYVFPSFLANLKNAGGTSEVVIRLKSFHELNKIRVTGRFFFGVPIIVLSIDGLTRAKTLNHSLLWTDLLLLIGLVGFGVQATCTLLIFMPRVRTVPV